MKPKSPHGYRIGIVNPLTLVGAELKSLLASRGFPYARLDLLDATGEHGGAVTEVADEPAIVHEAGPGSFEDLDIVFFCGSPSDTQVWIDRRGDDEFVAIDLCQPSAVDADGVRVVAGVNVDQLDEGTDLVVSPHPIAIPIALILSALSRKLKIRLCAASVIQPASEFGQAGVDELYEQTVQSLNLSAIPKTVFDRQLAFNMFPSPTAAEIETFVRGQVSAVLPMTFPLALSITQGTLFHGHGFSLFVETESPVDTESALAALRANPALALPEEEPFSTLEAAGRDEVLIGRVSTDPAVPNGLWLWAVSDNLRRSSALNAVLVAEEMVSRFGQPAN